MRQFQVGQKVRLVKVENPSCRHSIGDVGVVARMPGDSGNPLIDLACAMAGVPHYACDFPSAVTIALFCSLVWRAFA